MATILLLQSAGGNMTGLIIQFGAIIAIFYFLFIMPQRREAKRHREMVAALKPGDAVVTTGGLLGNIVQLTDTEVTLKSGDAKVQVERARIAKKIEG